MRVGVKFCGNCNPCVDAPALVKELGLTLTEYEFVRWNDPDGYEVLLILNSCPVGCATKPVFDGPCIIATSESVQRWPVPKCELGAAVGKLLKAFASGCRL